MHKTSNEMKPGLPSGDSSCVHRVAPVPCVLPSGFAHPRLSHPQAESFLREQCAKHNSPPSTATAAAALASPALCRALSLKHPYAWVSGAGQEHPCTPELGKSILQPPPWKEQLFCPPPSTPPAPPQTLLTASKPRTSLMQELEAVQGEDRSLPSLPCLHTGDKCHRWEVMHGSSSAFVVQGK